MDCRPWTDEEDLYVRDNFRRVAVETIAARIGRTPCAVRQRALKRLGLARLRKATPSTGWSKEQDEVLTTSYGRVAIRRLADSLGRSLPSLHSRALKLGLTIRVIRGPNRPWTEEDERFVLANYGKTPIENIAKVLNRTPGAIYQRACHPRKGTPISRKPQRRWSTSDDEYLRLNYGEVPTQVICGVLGRGIGSVHTRAHELSLTRPSAKVPPKPWTTDEDAYLRENYGKIRPTLMAKAIGRTRASLYHRAERLGLFSPLGSPDLLRRQSLPRTAKPFLGFASDLELGYVAGIMDGEGTINGPPRVTLQVSMTTREVIERLQQICGGSCTGPYENRSGRSEVCKPQYHGSVASAENSYRILEELAPHLIVKRDKAQEVLKYLRGRWQL